MFYRTTTRYLDSEGLCPQWNLLKEQAEVKLLQDAFAHSLPSDTPSHEIRLKAQKAAEQAFEELEKAVSSQEILDSFEPLRFLFLSEASVYFRSLIFNKLVDKLVLAFQGRGLPPSNAAEGELEPDQDIDPY